MATRRLIEDLKANPAEQFTAAELKAGRRRAVKVCGVVVVIGAVAALLAVTRPLTSLHVAGTATGRAAALLLDAYDAAAEPERKAIRALVTWIKGGFTLAGRLAG